MGNTEIINEINRSIKKIDKLQDGIGYVTSGIVDLPTGIGGTTLTSGVGDAYGSYVQISASLSADTIVYSISVWSSHSDDEPGSVSIIIGTGPPTEVQVAEVGAAINDIDDTNNLRATFEIVFVKPLFIASGTRVTAKINDGDASANNYTLKLHTVEI